MLLDSNAALGEPSPDPSPRGPEQESARRLAELGLVAALAAHDLNNALSIIRCCSSLLRTALREPEQTLALDDLDAGVQHGTELVRQIISFARARPLPSADVDLNRIVERMGWMLRRLSGGGMTVELALGRDLGAVRASEVQLEQLLINLAINARDAAASGGKLAIVTENVRVQGCAPDPASGLPPGEYVRLTVSDDGPGMAAEAQERLFEPFFTTKNDGNGLGLSSVARIVRQHGWHIRMRSSLESGTAFDVYLPRVKAPAGLAA